MRYENVLVNAYIDGFRGNQFGLLDPVEIDSRTASITESYIKLNHDYPADQIDRKGKIPADLFRGLKRFGLFGLSIPSEYGGAGLRLRQYLRVVEVLAAHNMSIGLTALAHLSIGVKGIVLFGNRSQKKTYLPAAASGEMIFAYALTEPKVGSNARHIETTAILSHDKRSYILKGHKAYITNANYAGAMTVFAQLDPERPGCLGAFIVETSWPGVRIGKEMSKMGLRASSTAAVHFDNVKVPRENLLGEPGQGFKIAMTILNYGRLALGAASAGMMKISFGDMARRSVSRVQFGLPIARYELIQEKMVAARLNAYVASAMTDYTAAMLEKNSIQQTSVESSHCKLFGTTRAVETLSDAMQVSGGSGYLRTQPYEQRMRDFRVTTIFEGTTEIHSIYPALYMLRQVSKKMSVVAKTPLARVLFLMKGALRRNTLRPAYRVSELNQAARLAQSLSARIRWMLHIGLLVYGKGISQRQFFLRRITRLSLHAFGLLAIVAEIGGVEKRQKAIEERLLLLSLFIQQARRTQKRHTRLWPSRKERLHSKLFKKISVLQHSK